jgi:hypothetical protein
LQQQLGENVTGHIKPTGSKTFCATSNKSLFVIGVEDNAIELMSQHNSSIVTSHNMQQPLHVLILPS